MIVLSASVRIVASTKRVTIQRDIDSLVRCVREELEEDPFSGDVYCFINPSRDRVKLLVWDRTGFWVLCKRLERGKFRRLEGPGRSLELTREDLIALLERIGPKTDRFLSNFEHGACTSSRGNDDRPERAADGSREAPRTAAR
jgi:transposase